MSTPVKPQFDQWPSLSDLQAQVVSGKVSAVSLVETALERIASLNPTYSAIISTRENAALQRAQEIDEMVRAKQPLGRLAGIPFIAKDNFLVVDGMTTAASNMLKNFAAPYQATAINLLEAEGAICIAKANLDAFAHGGSTENSDVMITKNPYDTLRVPGGSSGGSAAAVALGLAPFALGTDTGGSIRQQASYCGVVGYKPSYGLVSRSGVVAMASSTDVIGPIARTVDDAALVLDCIAGKDILDGTTIARPASLLPAKSTCKGLKIGVISEYMGEGVSADVRARMQVAIQAFQDDGAVVSEVQLPSLPLALAVYYVVVPAELSSNLSRYDGQRFGYHVDASTLEESYGLSRSQGFGREAKRRIMIGTHVLSSGYYDAYYKKAQTVRTKLIAEFEAALEEYDVLIGPVAPSVAFKIGALSDDPLQMYLQDLMTVAVSLAGLPAISVPCGHGEGDMPVGLQIIGAATQDVSVLQVARRFEEIAR